jgi:hydrogenase maturation protease
MTGNARAVVIGIGNEYRCDDGAGPAVAERLRGRLPADVDLLITDGEPADLVERWAGAELAIVVDAIAGSRPGRLHRVVIAGTESGGGSGSGALVQLADDARASSHHLGLRTAVGLAAALGRLPGTLVAHGVEAANFDHGVGLSPEIANVIEEIADAVLAEVS